MEITADFDQNKKKKKHQTSEIQIKTDKNDI